jgi:hypothetical protein
MRSTTVVVMGDGVEIRFPMPKTVPDEVQAVPGVS